MDILIPRYLAEHRRLADGLIPPSPPAETRHRRNAALLRDLRTYRGTLPPIVEPDRPRTPILLPGQPGYYETLQRAICMPAGSVMVMGGGAGAANPLASLTDAAGYWKLEESSGDRADSTSNANNLSPTSTPGNATGKLGNALAISSLQYVSKSSASAWDMSGWEWTIDCWLYITDKTDFRTAICIGGSGHVQYNLQYYKAPFGDAMNLGFEDDSQIGRAALGSTFGSPSLNTWFYCVTFGSATGGLAGGPRTGIRCNNGTANQDNHKSFYNRNTGLYIGAQFQSSAAYQWAGRIDEAGMWKRLITQSEQDLRYNSGNGASPF